MASLLPGVPLADGTLAGLSTVSVSRREHRSVSIVHGRSIASAMPDSVLSLQARHITTVGRLAPPRLVFDSLEMPNQRLTIDATAQWEKLLRAATHNPRQLLFTVPRTETNFVQFKIGNGVSLATRTCFLAGMALLLFSGVVADRTDGEWHEAVAASGVAVLAATAGAAMAVVLATVQYGARRPNVDDD